MFLEGSSRPGMDHWKAAKKVKRYLQQTKNFMVVYSNYDEFKLLGLCILILREALMTLNLHLAMC